MRRTESPKSEPVSLKSVTLSPGAEDPALESWSSIPPAEPSMLEAFISPRGQTEFHFLSRNKGSDERCVQPDFVRRKFGTTYLGALEEEDDDERSFPMHEMDSSKGRYAAMHSDKTRDPPVLYQPMP